MPQIRTSRSYAKLSDPALSEFAGGTVAGFTANLELPNPIVPPPALTSLKTAFDNAIVKAATGGPLDTSAKNSARVGLTAALDKNAGYVDITCDGDLTVLLSSGYQAVSTNRSQAVLNPPQIVAAEYGQSGQIRLRIKGDPNRRAVQGRIKKLGDTEFGPALTFRSAKAIIFEGLTAGVTYVMQLIGIGGSTGKSDWSETVTKIAL